MTAQAGGVFSPGVASLKYLSENSQHLLFTKLVIEHLRSHHCEVRVNGGSSLGLYKRGNFLLNDRDVDLHVSNKTYEEISDIMRPFFPQDKGVANVHGKIHTFYKTRNTSCPDFKFDLDITTPDSYWTYSGLEVVPKILQLFAEPAKSMVVQGLEFPVPNKLKETLILSFERYRPKPGEFEPVYDEDDLDLGKLASSRFVIAGKFDPLHYAHKYLIERVMAFTRNFYVLLFSSDYLKSNGIMDTQSDEERLSYMSTHLISAELYDGGDEHDGSIWIFGADDEAGAQAYYSRFLSGKDALWMHRTLIRCLQPE